MPPFACSNQPAAAADRAGEGALLVAEQLGVDQLGRDGAAIHPPKRSAAEGGVFVNRPRDDLLARAGFAEERAPARCSARRRGRAP